MENSEISESVPSLRTLTVVVTSVVKMTKNRLRHKLKRQDMHLKENITFSKFVSLQLCPVPQNRKLGYLGKHSFT